MNDFIQIIIWFITLFVIGFSVLPLTFSLFNNFKDKGYIFSKIIGISIISYLSFLTATLHLLKFNQTSIIFLLLFTALINYGFAKFKRVNVIQIITSNKLSFLEELIFLLCLIFWSFVRANSPDIHGLEKFMDFGFINSILRSDYFPPKDMWYTPFSINYYYFGHLATALLTKLSTLPSYITFNLMVATIFSFTFSLTYSIGMNLFVNNKKLIKTIVYSLLPALAITFIGNLTTIYAFFKPYPSENPVPFWKLAFMPFSFLNNFWYPNATRFIPFTIHEFPLYSFVVSDLHGHVLDIPFVLLIIGFSLSIFYKKNIKFLELTFFAFILSIMYMTNAWDGLIYLLLGFLVILFTNENTIKFSDILKKSTFLFSSFFVFSLPFSFFFKPFVSGIGILCSPSFLTNIGKLGPFLFEANHCQKSAAWQLLLLYGFFYFFVILFLLFLRFKKDYKLLKSDKFILLLISLATILIIIPEFIYVKDIYPLHYRANTMFKLVYQSFIMLSIVSAYIYIKLITNIKNKILLACFFILSILLIYLVSIYPFFAIGSYYRNLKTYQGLNGIKYISYSYPGDYALIMWINKNIQGQPVVLEASGDSYTDYARISANTGLPTVLGWSVHEWLWRGSYDYAAPRIADIQTLYTTKDLVLAKKMINKYSINYVVVSGLEKQKYTNLNEDNFKKLGKVIFKNNEALLYKINN